MLDEAPQLPLVVLYFGLDRTEYKKIANIGYHKQKRNEWSDNQSRNMIKEIGFQINKRKKIRSLELVSHELNGCIRKV
ncbi:hypothetical protein HI914_01220 [Erysiphe necator]|nr:hypothetical protein HI914_01220 [Erysiphe necator]